MMKKFPSSQRGFALVIALSLMAFVLLLILSISTLVQVESQSASSGMQQMRARLNAQCSGAPERHVHTREVLYSMALAPARPRIRAMQDVPGAVVREVDLPAAPCRGRGLPALLGDGPGAALAGTGGEVREHGHRLHPRG